jgi:hypothetical protein
LYWTSYSKYYFCAIKYFISSVSITKLYELLIPKLGRETAEDLTSYVEEKLRDGINDKTQILATKLDLANAKTDTIKWMFIFWVGQIGATFGLILLFTKK